MAAFSVRGVIDDTSSAAYPVDAIFEGTFSNQFGVPYQTLLNTVLTGGSVPTPYSATFTVTPIPEPSTFGLLGLGLVAFGLIRRYRN